MSDNIPQPDQPIVDVKTPVITQTQQPINGQPSGLVPNTRSLKQILLWSGGIALAIILAFFTIVFIWYTIQLSPASNDVQKRVPITIVSGTSPVEIGKLLEEQSIIRSSAAFEVYTRLSGSRDSLQAGSYRLAPSESLQDIVAHLVNGNVDQFSITFLPGDTVIEHKTVLLKAGYSQTEIDTAFATTYTSPLFDTKPSTTDLEGYIYGETYYFGSGASVKDILEYTFDTYEQVITDNNLVAQFKTQGLSLYQGITLASIIQREVLSVGGATTPTSDQQQVAQVFFSRLTIGMPLGSDVTFIYGAKKLGVEPISTLNSPYNTRIIAGLPPGPISSPGLTALIATAQPADGDYLYFVAGDDGTTHFGRTLVEHEQNVRQYCTIECNKP